MPRKITVYRFRVAMGVTPLMIGTDPDASNYGAGFERTLMIYGIPTLSTAVPAVLQTRYFPPTPISEEKLVHKPAFTILGVFNLLGVLLLKEWPMAAARRNNGG
jgi:hypothetical protein